jgi:hypothetical protein
MCFLAEMLAVMVVWLSSVALGQFGVVLDKTPAAKPSHERTVSRSPRAPIATPIAVVPSATPAPMA